MQINNIVTTVNKSPTLWRYLNIKLGPKVGEIRDKNSEESKICSLTLTCLVSIFVAFIFQYLQWKYIFYLFVDMEWLVKQKEEADVDVEMEVDIGQ